MHLFFQVVNDKLLAIADTFLRDYVIKKYGPKTILCTVTGKDNRICADLGLGESTKWEISADVCYPIRKQCGEYIMLRYGPPRPDSDPPVVVLFPTLSLLMTLGFTKFIKFIRDWPGDSKAGDVSVVKYTIS